MRAAGALRQVLGLAVGGAALAVIALTYEGCDRFEAAPYAYLVLAAILAGGIGGIAETEREERLRAGAFAGVVVGVAGLIVLLFVFAADSCTGA